MKWQLLSLISLKFIVLSNQSIEGVTYQTHFNFEERYSSVRECDPFYWYPLHLPEHCMQMYEKLIRSRVAGAAQSPVQVVRQQNPCIYNEYEPVNYDQPTFYKEYSQPNDQIYVLPDHSEIEEDKSMSPYEEMYSYLKKDVRNNPSAPVVGMVPNYGPIAVYKQLISRKSKNLITKIAQAYANAGKIDNDDDELYYGNIDVKYPESEISDRDKHQKKIDINKDKNNMVILDNGDKGKKDKKIAINKVVGELRKRLNNL